MRRFAPMAVVLAILPLIVPSPAVQAQERSPEMKFFEYFIGDWTYGSEANPGTMSFEWHGEGFLKCTEHSPTGRDYIHMWGYDESEEAYHGCRFSTTGYWDCFTGWVEGQTFTWLMKGPPTPLTRIALEIEGEDNYTFTWSRAIKGGEWEVGSPGRATRVKN